jgi:hypothetical protein
VWRKVNSLEAKIPKRRYKFKVGDLVMIRKGKVKFARGYEQRFSTDLFTVVKVIERVQQTVY